MPLALERPPGKLSGLSDATGGKCAGIFQARFQQLSQQRQPAWREGQLQFRFARKFQGGLPFLRTQIHVLDKLRLVRRVKRHRLAPARRADIQPLLAHHTRDKRLVARHALRAVAGHGVAMRQLPRGNCPAIGQPQFSVNRHAVQRDHRAVGELAPAFVHARRLQPQFVARTKLQFLFFEHCEAARAVCR